MTGAFRKAPGHRSYSGPASARVTIDHGLIERVRVERARRALYADCERAPVGWEGR
jgi:hypothetical protein